jgi:hypothetical protein
MKIQMLLQENYLKKINLKNLHLQLFSTYSSNLRIIFRLSDSEGDAENEDQTDKKEEKGTED